MWLMQYITHHSLNAPAAVKGELSGGDTGGVSVASSGEHKELEFCFPYGLVSMPPRGERAVVLLLDDGEAGMGVLRGGAGLEEGEVMLYSAGGASLMLKNDGRVLINGREVGNG